jgi:hypothetical protein
MAIIRNVANGILGLVGLKIADGQIPAAPRALTQYERKALEISRLPQNRARVNEHLRRAGIKIEERRHHQDIPIWGGQGQFDSDVRATENDYARRNAGRTIANNNGYLRDGGVFRPED